MLKAVASRSDMPWSSAVFCTLSSASAWRFNWLKHHSYG